MARDMAPNRADRGYNDTQNRLYDAFDLPDRTVVYVIGDGRRQGVTTVLTEWIRDKTAAGRHVTLLNQSPRLTAQTSERVRTPGGTHNANFDVTSYSNAVHLRPEPTLVAGTTLVSDAMWPGGQHAGRTRGPLWGRGDVPTRLVFKPRCVADYRILYSLLGPDVKVVGGATPSESPLPFNIPAGGRPRRELVGVSPDMVWDGVVNGRRRSWVRVLLRRMEALTGADDPVPALGTLALLNADVLGRVRDMI